MKYLGIALIAVVVAGCSTVPVAVNEQAGRTLSPQCRDLFASENYQRKTQFYYASPVFTIAVAENKTDMICSYAAQDYLSAYSESNSSLALDRCEAAKPVWVYQNKTELGACQVFAVGNKIMFEDAR